MIADRILAGFAQSVERLGGILHAINTRELLTTSVDVIIVFYIVYRVLKLVRGTRAAQTMVGMALLGGLFFIAKKLDLFAVSWLFERLLDYLIIFVVVIFQQDLRRALMQVGQNLFSRRPYEETYVIEEVVQATGELAKAGMGALIAIERDADLSEHLGEVGVELDARVTKELLVTLFIPEPQNHMHDGAVIIRNLRVQQAGAVLPLSANAKLDKQFGTRHRAAIGITEETDAVVVVVSEERGTVSLCFNGNIARDLDAATLRKALLGLFQKKKNKGKTPQAAARPRRPGDTSQDGSAPTDAKPVPALAAAAASASASAPATVPASAHSGAYSGTTGKKLPAELMPLFNTQQIERPVLADTLPIPHANPPAVLPPSAMSDDITAPMLSMKDVMDATNRAAERAAAASEWTGGESTIETTRGEVLPRSPSSPSGRKDLKGAETR